MEVMSFVPGPGIMAASEPAVSGKAEGVEEGVLEGPWGEYLQAVLLESGHVQAAALHGLPEGQEWATTPGFQVSPEEVQALVQGLWDPSKLRGPGGLRLQGSEYTLIRTAERRILVGRDCSTGNGCVAYRCNTCMLIAVYNMEEGNHAGGCYAVVLKLGDFLTENGF